MIYKDLVQRFPGFPWDKPLTVSLISNPDEKHYACRICIFNKGLKGSELESAAYPTPEAAQRHIDQQHIHAS